jgi:type IV pilus assembly protein PilW
MNRYPHTRKLPTSHQYLRGFGIIELMVAMALGLFLVGGAISIFLANQQAYRTTEQLARMQENGRTSVELMSRRLREAGGSPCGRGVPTANTINNAGTYWWSNWETGLQGYDNAVAANGVDFGTTAARRIEGTDAVFLTFADASTGAVIEDHVPTAAQFQLNTNDHGLDDGEIALVCNYRQAAILQVTNINSSNSTVVHNTGTGTPGNCSKGLGFPTDCTSVNGNEYTFDNGFLVRLVSEIWYVGANGRGGGRSLYRSRLVNVAGTPTTQAEEIAEGVTDLQMTYLQADAAGVLPTDYVDAATITDWAEVSAMRVTLTLQSLQSVGTDGAPLQRQMTYVVTLRNRLP